MSTDVQQQQGSLWALAVPPVIWAGHFLLSYCTAAVWCAKFAGADGSLATARIIIAVYTTLALLGLLAAGLRGYRRHRLAGARAPHDADTPEDRYRFMGYATMLLSGLSCIAVIYEALAIVLIRSCF